MIQTGITFHQPGFETDGNSRVSIKPGKEKKDGKFRANLGKSSGSDPDTAGEVRRRPARSDDVRRGQTTAGEVRRRPARSDDSGEVRKSSGRKRR
jgi:hypothetical protein